MIRTVIVDDHTLMRSGIRGLLELTEDIRVVGEAGDGDEAVRVVTDLLPDLLLLDIKLPGRSGLQVLESLAARNALPPTILLTTFGDDVALLEGIRAGARGFLLKDVSLERLVEAIRTVVDGKRYFRPGLTERVLSCVKTMPLGFESLDPPCSLTPREIEVLALVAGGCSNLEIAASLGMSEGTVKNHVSTILSKLGVRDRVQAVLKGLETGLL
ncbi:MAG: response regulator transcription factor [Methylococcaceae bacterium]|nr:response regulator transcription factor [Methylococcaceae bacterium]